MFYKFPFRGILQFQNSKAKTAIDYFVINDERMFTLPTGIATEYQV